MISKERVYAALKRQPVDRVPIFMWFHPETAIAMGKELGVSPDEVSLKLGDDIAQTWVGNNTSMEGVTIEEGSSLTDSWGIEWVREGFFNQINQSPLEFAPAEEMLEYTFPVAQIDQMLKFMEAFLAKVNPDLFIGCDVSPCVFELANRIRGMESCVMDLAAEPEPAKVFLQRCGDFSAGLAEAACSRFDLDWLWTGDDVGSQQAMIMSPDCWREMIKPSLKKVFEVGKKHNLLLAYHSCGSIRPIIPDLIEIGLDVLNPIQGNCPGMDPYELKKEFGKDLAFMGGVDTQDFLPNASVDEVYDGTSRLIEAMIAEGGGYIMAASHTVPPETPVENIFAMYKAAGVSISRINSR